MISSKGDLNIPRSVKDPNYRYTMHKIVSTTQGTGGGVKTKFDNIHEVAKDLKVPTDYPLKFMARELGTMSEIKNEVYLINGSHTSDKLQQVLDKFIDKYVLCPLPKCRLPEIRIFIKKDEIRSKCKACGEIAKLDDKHKFTTHIRNFPPKYDENEDKAFVPDIDKKDKGKIQEEKKKSIDKETKEKMSKYFI